MRYATCYESVRLATRPVGLGVDLTGAGTYKLATRRQV